MLNLLYTHTDHCGGGKDRTKLDSCVRRGGSLLGLGSRPIARGLLEGVLVRKLGIGLLQPRQLHFHEGVVGGTSLLGLLAGLLRGHRVLAWDDDGSHSKTLNRPLSLPNHQPIFAAKRSATGNFPSRVIRGFGICRQGGRD